MKSYAKAIAGALASALSIGAEVTLDNSLSLNDGFKIAAAFAVGFGAVYATNNNPT